MTPILEGSHIFPELFPTQEIQHVAIIHGLFLLCLGLQWRKGPAARRAKTPVNHMGRVGFWLVSFVRDTNSRPPSGILSGNGLGDESRGEDRPQASPGGAVGETLMRRAMRAAGRGVKQAEVSSLARMECLSVLGGDLCRMSHGPEGLELDWSLVDEWQLCSR